MLRELRIEDALGMYSWMQDVSITRSFDKDFSKYTIIDCEDYIKQSIKSYNRIKPLDINYAIVNDNDEYKGTVSLKHINYDVKCAEFAIVLVGEAHGSGLAKIAFEDIMQYGFEKLWLDFIYFSCKKDNIVANKFYSKTNAELINVDKLVKKLRGGVEGYNISLSTLYWYMVYK